MKKSTAKIETNSPKETQRVAKEFIRQLFEKPPEKDGALVIALQGELGSGKTTFIQGVAQGLGIKEKVLSPTFLIIRTYPFFHALRGIQKLYHVDCYRLREHRELRELGCDSIVSDSRNLIFIEWPGRVQKILPKKVITLKFLAKGEKGREITIWQQNRKLSLS